MKNGAKFICFFSGGKDCGLAFSIATKIGVPVAIITCVKQECARFHSHGTQIIDMQAKKMGVSVEYINCHWKDEKNISQLYEKYRSQGVEYVVFGDLSDEYNANIKIDMCKKNALIPFMPLFKLKETEIMDKIEEHKIKCILSAVRPSFGIEDYVGHVLTRELFRKFQNLGINPLGENGEYHTTLVGMDVFDEEIPYIIKGKRMLTDKHGEKIFCDIELIKKG